jgi:hypothetical protein
LFLKCPQAAGNATSENNGLGRRESLATISLKKHNTLLLIGKMHPTPPRIAKIFETGSDFTYM